MLASQPVSSSPVKAAVAVPQPESNAADDEEDDGEFSEPMQKTAAAAKSKTVEQECQKRSAPDPGPFSKRNKAKVVAGGSGLLNLSTCQVTGEARSWCYSTHGTCRAVAL
jgi:hypothetical protein